VRIHLFETPGLGDNSYLIASQGQAVLIDPQRDAWRFLEAARAEGLTIRYVLETHVHNDYLTGALEVREATGAEIVAPERGGYRFPHRPAREGLLIPLGELALVAWETPGHTPEHLCWLLYRQGEPWPLAVFTGGSLTVGGAGRTDLLGPELTRDLAILQFRSLRRLASLPDSVQVLPTHGAGSFCTAGPSRERTSTLGRERSANRALAAPDAEEFLTSQLSGLPAFPAYYAYMASINRHGPRLLGGLPLPPAIAPAEAEAALRRGAWLVDGRDRRSFARAHLPGAINVELDSTFASYVGWVVPFGEPLLLVLPGPEEETLSEAATQLMRIGYEEVWGYLRGGVEAWAESGRPLRSYPIASVEELCRAVSAGESPQVLDVRQRPEWERGHIPGSQHIFVGELPRRLAEVPPGREVWTICASGHRAALAASILDAAGYPVRLVGDGGVQDWLAACRGG
jgi:hydroxyacylglutathione hydrolase